jgi:glycosyltransferase involved in cell wall biosynthesis
VVYNWVDEDVFKPMPRSTRSGNGFDLMYAGNLGDVQGLDVAVRALAELKDRPDISLRFVGGGVAQPSLQKLACELGVADRVMFEGLHPLEGMAELMATADAQLVCLKDLPLFHATMPSKTQAILACGQPVVVSAPGDVAALVEQSGAGLTAEPGNAVALAAAFRTMADLSPEARASLGSRGRDFYEAELCASVGAARLEVTMTKAAGTWPA